MFNSAVAGTPVGATRRDPASPWLTVQCSEASVLRRPDLVNPVAKLITSFLGEVLALALQSRRDRQTAHVYTNDVALAAKELPKRRNARRIIDRDIGRLVHSRSQTSDHIAQSTGLRHQ